MSQPEMECIICDCEVHHTNHKAIETRKLHDQGHYEKVNVTIIESRDIVKQHVLTNVPTNFLDSNIYISKSSINFRLINI